MKSPDNRQEDFVSSRSIVHWRGVFRGGMKQSGPTRRNSRFATATIRFSRECAPCISLSLSLPPFLPISRTSALFPAPSFLFSRQFFARECINQLRRQVSVFHPLISTARGRGAAGWSHACIRNTSAASCREPRAAWKVHSVCAGRLPCFPRNSRASSMAGPNERPRTNPLSTCIRVHGHSAASVGYSSM